MVYQGMMFGDVVTVVVISRGPVVSKLFLTDTIVKPVVFMSMALSFFMTLLFTTPRAVVLSVWIGVSGCECPKDSSVCRAGMAL